MRAPTTSIASEMFLLDQLELNYGSGDLEAVNEGVHGTTEAPTSSSTIER